MALIISIIFVFIYASVFANGSLSSKYNACGCDHSYRANLTHVINRAPIYHGFDITCCANHFLGEMDVDFNITWEFTGTNKWANSANSFEVNSACFGQKISNRRMTLLDGGNHTCTITGADGRRFRKTFQVKILTTKKSSVEPESYNISNAIYVTKGKNATLRCAFTTVNNTEYPDVFWRKIHKNASGEYMEIGRMLPNTQEKMIIRNREVVSYLTLKSVDDIHFGIYLCQIVTSSSVISHNITVINGVYPNEALVATMKIQGSLSVVYLFLLLLSAWIAFRLRLSIALKWRETTYKYKASTKKSRQSFIPCNFHHDAFIIHGPSATFWVYEVLLERLEGEWLYQCFLPVRDIKAGQGDVETITQELSKSRRIIVVVTQCLLRSQWCAFMMYQAIHNALSQSTRVVAIILTDISCLEEPSIETERLINILKCIRKIRCPLKFIPESLTCISPIEVDDKQNRTHIEPKCPPEHHEKNSITLKENGKEEQELKEAKKFQAKLTNSLSTPNFKTLSPSSSNSLISLPHFHLYFPSSFSLTMPQAMYQMEMKENGTIPLTLPNQRVSNMISGSSTFMENRREETYSQTYQNNFNEKDDPELKISIDPPDNNFHPDEDLKHTSKVNSELTENYENISSYAEKKRKPLYSESSEGQTMSPCSDASFFPEDQKFSMHKSKNFKTLLRDIFIGNPNTMFWRQLRLHLPNNALYKDDSQRRNQHS